MKEKISWFRILSITFLLILFSVFLKWQLYVDEKMMGYDNHSEEKGAVIRRLKALEVKSVSNEKELRQYREADLILAERISALEIKSTTQTTIITNLTQEVSTVRKNSEKIKEIQIDARQLRQDINANTATNLIQNERLGKLEEQMKEIIQSRIKKTIIEAEVTAIKGATPGELKLSAGEMEKIAKKIFTSRYMARDSRPTPFIIGPFKPGSASEPKRDIVSKCRQLRTEQIGEITLYGAKFIAKVTIIVGSYDFSPLVNPKTIHLFGSNKGLAFARAKFVAEEVGFTGDIKMLNDPDFLMSPEKMRSVFVGVSYEQIIN